MLAAIIFDKFVKGSTLVGNILMISSTGNHFNIYHQLWLH
jgi:hypothetical protein